MDITTFNQPGMQIIHRADEGLTRTAAQVAREASRADERSEEMETATVKSFAYEQQGYAGVRVVRAVDDTLGTLLNIKS
ncbi:hypothetical protein LRD18_01520 [Halorhodospira halochloris]|uniref:Flagellar basal-body/hook protein C-terminal domain-containing protein n=1 Tax=Halorhodospira halochloris TaxID=1052 RepID=A0A0X8XAI0_HALHR|nr:hypothetical protein [Halorhodospira halochloris]MBK1651630.1 hypothetical protein [Halorhodospira halochloris]MCG5529552.1 hypothetical protein [Halorhodospira halochloris]MCG5548169.1 hypothetical protein [Halorhodospira halochloris]BAU58492.1 hypothetical protein HH1059_18050 [Halorhodospira halochloris]